MGLGGLSMANYKSGDYKIQNSRFKIFIGITGQQVSFTNSQHNTQNINTNNTQKHIK